MSYERETLLNVLRKIETHSICLPAIQRKFVWNDMGKIEKLFDSLFHGYPIGSFLVWQVEENDIGNYTFYEINNQYSAADGNWQQPRTEATTHTDYWALLDGQQRLTSLAIGIQGSFKAKKPNARRNNPGGYLERFLFFSLKGAAEAIAPFKFMTEQEARSDENNLWIRVSDFIRNLKAFHIECPEKTEKPEAYTHLEQVIRQSVEFKSEELRNFWLQWDERNQWRSIGSRINKFARRLAHEKNFNYYLIPGTTTLDTCAEIFVRINDGGVKLSKADLLFSMVVSTWQEGRSHIDETIRVVKTLGYEIDTDFVMRTSLYLTGSPIIVSAAQLSKDRNIISAIQEAYRSENPEVTDINESIIEVFTFLKERLGISDKTLSSYNVVIPLIHHVFKGGRMDVLALAEAKKYIYLSLLKNVFGSHGDTLLADLRKSLTSEDGGYVLENSSFMFSRLTAGLELEEKVRLYRLEESDFENFSEVKKGSDAWIVLSLLYENIDYPPGDEDQDHLHPRSKLLKTRNEDIIAVTDLLPNLGLLLPDENRKIKRAKDLQEYVTSRADQGYYVNRNFLTGLSLAIADFPSFYDQRRQMIITRLKEIFNYQPEV
jgi:hypothetical protein